MINNAIVISDIHAGCQFGLCPPKITLDGGGTYTHSVYQAQTWKWWKEFWERWVPHVCRGEKFCVIMNGDALDGMHHNSNHQITHNLSDQSKIAEEVLAPVVELCNGAFYLIRGTSAHVGPSGQEEEKLAKRLGAIQDESGNYSRFELWMKLANNCLCHFTHHIGTTGTTAYQTTAPMKELTEQYTSAAQWDEEPPDVVVRSHRHQHVEIRIPTKRDYAYCFTTAAWQLKTPYVYKLPGGRYAPPMIGGSLIRQGDEDFYTRHFTRIVPRSRIVEV